MSEPFIGQIKIFAGNFAPRGYAFCEGAILPIAQYTALFSIFGTTYGGDGRSTFGLPDLIGRVPLGSGIGAGLTPRQLGARFGDHEEVLNVPTMPSHNHQLRGDSNNSNWYWPGQTMPARSTRGNSYGSDSPVAPMAAAAIDPTGSGDPHNNLMPTAADHYIVALVGLFPSRN